MYQKIIIFDFTDLNIHKQLRDFEPDYLRMNSFRESYSVEEYENGKVKVSILDNDYVCYECIYYKKTMKDIEEQYENEQYINLEGCYIKDFDISKIPNINAIEPIAFDASYSFWDGKMNFAFRSLGIDYVNFNRANFGDGFISFINTNFGNGLTSFEYANFGNGDIAFNDAKFGEGVNFANATFGKGHVSFTSADFGMSDVSFYRTNFGDGNVDFNLAYFGSSNEDYKIIGNDILSRDISFRFATFMGDVSFDYAIFEKGFLSFLYTQFKGEYISFYNTKFKGDVFFKKAKLEGEISFANAIADNIRFCNNIFLTHANLEFSSIDSLIIKDCKIEKTMKIAGKPKTLSFCKTSNLGKIYFFDEYSFIIETLKKSLNEKDINFVYTILNSYDIYVENDDDEIKITNQIKLQQFTLIKENFRELGAYDGEDIAYSVYMDTKIKSMKWSIKRFTYSIFNVIGKYGTRPISIIVWATIIIVGFGLIYWPFMECYRKGAAIPKIIEGLYFSFVSFLTAGSDITPPNTAIAFLAGLEGFIGMFLLSYFTVAVVRKLLR